MLFVVAMIPACLAAAYGLAPLQTWYRTGPVLLFLGLLTLVNAPFDWASLGLTRALLRRGLELAGWWPLALAFLDAMAAAVGIAALATVMVVAVQAFDGLAVHGGGKPVLPLGDLLDGIAHKPAEPEYWWVYVLLLSTMVPSLINLAIGAFSLLRGIPGLPALLLKYMPAGHAVPLINRSWIAAVLTAQIVVGGLFGLVGQAAIAYGIVVYAMPPVGAGLLDMARAVAAFDLPLRIGRLFAGIL